MTCRTQPGPSLTEGNSMRFFSSSPRPFAKKIIALCALLAAPGYAQQAAVPVSVATVEQADVPVWLKSLGQVKPLQSVEIRPQVDGVLQQVLVREGEQVQAAQLLATLDDRSIRAALAQAVAELEVVKAQLQIARRDLQRYQDLKRSQAVSAQLIDQQQAQVQQLEAQKRRVEAAIDAQQVQLSFTQIKSPLGGQVGIRNVDAGNYVRPTDSAGLFSVVQLDPVSIEMALPQTALPALQQLMSQVRAGEAVPVQAFADDGGVLLATGQLSVVDNKVATGSGTVRVKAEFANPDHQLWPAQTVVTALRTRLLKDALTVPARAIQQGPQGSYVWLLADGKATNQPVELVLTQGDISVVTGLQSGQQVVIDGQSRLRPGAAVSIEQAVQGAQASQGQQNAQGQQKAAQRVISAPVAGSQP